MRRQGVQRYLVRSLFWAMVALPATAYADGGAPLVEAPHRPTPARASLLHAARARPRLVRAGLTWSERRVLLTGDTVSRPLAFERHSARYVGGVSYQLVRAAPSAVMAALSDEKSLPWMLPRTQRARRVGGTERDKYIELTQGTAFVSATYTVRARRVEGRNELRFWLDRTRPHGIDDVWGYFRVQAFDGGRSLVTVAVALDLGPGLARLLFENRIQRAILTTPGRIRDFIEPRALAFAR